MGANDPNFERKRGAGLIRPVAERVRALVGTKAPKLAGLYAEGRLETETHSSLTVPADAIDGSETRTVEVKARQTLTFEGQNYLLGFALPNFYFHIVTAYAILRHNGVEVGKQDFIGQIPLKIS